MLKELFKPRGTAVLSSAKPSTSSASATLSTKSSDLIDSSDEVDVNYLLFLTIYSCKTTFLLIKFG